MRDILPDALQEIKDLSQWVAYQKIWNEDRQKYSKIPKNARTGYGAKANDPATWCDYETAIRGAEKLNLDGVGFEFAGGYLGVDLDHVIHEDGSLDPIAKEVIETLDSYTEYSPSRTGVHIIVKTDIPKIGARNDEIGLEMYNNGRFFTMTGEIFGEEKPIADRTEEIKSLYRKYCKREEKKSPDQRPGQAYEVTESDNELWSKMFNSQRGSEIKALYDGDLSRHDNDHSRADQAMINHLAYWTNGDARRMDALFRQCGLMRKKWDERRGSDTYGNKTIENALRSFSPYIQESSGGWQSPSQRLQNNTEQQSGESNMSNKNNTVNTPQTSVTSNNSKPDSVTAYLSEAFGADLSRFQSFKDRKTGYSNLDQITSLYPGLYVIGAISSLGKTTFTHQLGDQLAETGDHVLYFSLEQSRLEMVTKSLSRITALRSQDPVSAIDIRRGKITPAVKEAVKEYAQKGSTVSVIECNFDTTIEWIIQYIKDYMKENEVAPVVIIDYLQIIPATPEPNGHRPIAKDVVDDHVRALKKLQSENDLVMIVISALNRQNYLTPVDFESFKESGGIEYTADVVWGLQLAIMNDDLFNSQNKLKEKREKVKQAKRADPRVIELVCLKNRYGVANYSCQFNYRPKYDVFIPLISDFVPAVGAGDNPFL